MRSLGLLALLVAAAAALPIDDSVSIELKDDFKYRCVLKSHYAVKSDSWPLYVCTGNDGKSFVFTAKALGDDSVDAYLSKDLPTIRAKRQFGGGFGGSNAQAHSFGGGGGGGFGGGPFGGFGGPGGGFGGGGGFSQAQSSSFGGGGGFGGGSPFFG